MLSSTNCWAWQKSESLYSKCKFCITESAGLAVGIRIDGAAAVLFHRGQDVGQAAASRTLWRSRISRRAARRHVSLGGVGRQTGSLNAICGVLCQPHFRQRQEKGQHRFRSLVLVAPVLVQPIATTAGLRGVEFQPEIVPAEEPVEGALRLLIPPRVGCGAVRFQASRDRGLRLDGLLVEVRARAVTLIESVTADGPQLTLL